MTKVIDEQMLKESYEQKLKELREKFPDVVSHDYDEYRCKYYIGLLDLQFDYIKELEKNCENWHKRAIELAGELLPFVTDSESSDEE